jgi:hypothetical protein
VVWSHLQKGMIAHMTPMKIERTDFYEAVEEHAGERGGSLPRTDAAQIRGNLALVGEGDGAFERRESTARSRELKRPK